MENWVMEITHYREEDGGLVCFVPIENIGQPNETLVLGMNILSDVEHFDLGKIVGIVHLDGQEAVDKWVELHPEIFQALKRRKEVSHEKLEERKT